MSGQDLAFLVVALIGGASAILTVTSRNLFHAALYLAVALASIAGVFFVMRADFLGLVQILVYVGAVAVLFLFGLMLTRAPIGREALDSQNRALGFGVALALFAVLSALVIDAFGDVAPAIAGPDIGAIGIAIFAHWVLPFEILSMVLLAALVGAILLARREEGDTGEPDVAIHIEMATSPDQDAADAEAVAVGQAEGGSGDLPGGSGGGA